MVKETITLQQVIEHIDSGHYFDLVVISCDIKQDTGGEEIHYNNVRKHMHLTWAEQKKLEKSQPKDVKRNPNHFANSTRNIKLPNGDINTLHLRLIRRFNEKTVM